MEVILIDFFTGVLTNVADHVLAYLGIGAAAGGGGYALHVKYRKSVTNSESSQENSGSIQAADDVVNGNQTINNNYYISDPSGDKKLTDKYRKTPMPNQILKEVQRLPESDQHLAHHEYLGKHFQWNVKFYKLNKKEGDKIRVYFSDPDEFGKPMIYCDLNLKDHPQLDTLNEGEDLKVAGKLTCFSGQEMNLDLDQVAYDDAEFTLKDA